MNLHIKLIGSACALLAFSTLALAQSPSAAPVPYHYGMPLHVVRVVSMSEPATQECKVVTAQMAFVDPTGRLETISYSKLSDACSTQD